MTKSKLCHLKVVWDKDACSDNTTHYFEPYQLNLMLDHYENLISFVGEGVLSGMFFSDVLRTIRPHFILDLRTCPRFDFDGYSRKKAFDEFERHSSRYLSLSIGEMSEKSVERTKTMVDKLGRGISKGITGPIVVLFESEDSIDEIVRVMPKPSTQAGEWEITTVYDVANSEHSSVQGLTWKVTQDYMP